MTTNVTWIAPDVPALPKLMWLSELGRLNQIPGVVLTPITGKVTRQDVAIALSKKSDVVIWSGHGKSGGLILSDESIMDALWLAVRLAAPDTSPQVVVLAACASQEKDVALSSLTATISRNGVTVIGFPALTDDQAASDFIVEFVGAVTVTTPMQAFDVAIAAISKTTTAKGVFMMNGAMEYTYRIHKEIRELQVGVREIRDILLRTSTYRGTIKGQTGAVEAGEEPTEEDDAGDTDLTSQGFRGIGGNEPTTKVDFGTDTASPAPVVARDGGTSNAATPA